MHQQLWRYKVEEKIYREVRERKSLNITDLDSTSCSNRTDTVQQTIRQSDQHYCPFTTSFDSFFEHYQATVQ